SRRDRGPGPGGAAVGGAAVEDLVVGERVAVPRVERGGQVEGVQVVRVDRGQPGVVLLVRQQVRPGQGEVEGLPGAAVEPGVDEPVVAEVGVLRLVPGAGGEHCGQLTGLVATALADVGGPGVGEPCPAELGPGGQDRGQLHLGGGLGAEHGLVHRSAVAAVQGAAGDVPVVDRVVVVARVV